MNGHKFYDQILWLCCVLLILINVVLFIDFGVNIKTKNNIS